MARYSSERVIIVALLSVLAISMARAAAAGPSPISLSPGESVFVACRDPELGDLGFQGNRSEGVLITCRPFGDSSPIPTPVAAAPRTPAETTLYLPLILEEG